MCFAQKVTTPNVQCAKKQATIIDITQQTDTKTTLERTALRTMGYLLGIGTR